MNKVRIIGDVHGKTDKYLDIAKQAECSIQLGDMAFDYSHMDELEYGKHSFIKGNHDNHDQYSIYSRDRFGMVDVSYSRDNPLSFYYVSGGHSIDKRQRQEYIDWWPNEELSYKEMSNCISHYGYYSQSRNLQDKPIFNVVLSHEAPITATSDSTIFNTDILTYWGYSRDWSSNTAILLEMMWQTCKPKLWIFGHHHIFFDKVIDGTRFICLPELGWCDINNDGEVLDIF